MLSDVYGTYMGDLVRIKKRMRELLSGVGFLHKSTSFRRASCHAVWAFEIANLVLLAIDSSRKCAPTEFALRELA